jgi:hypothetical protein
MNWLKNLFGRKSEKSAEPAGNRANELKREFNITISGDGTLFDGTFHDEFKEQMGDPSWCVALLLRMEEKGTPFDKICVVLGDPVTFVINGKPNPVALVSSLDPSGLEAVMLSLEEKGWKVDFMYGDAVVYKK